MQPFSFPHPTPLVSAGQRRPGEGPEEGKKVDQKCGIANGLSWQQIQNEEKAVVLHRSPTRVFLGCRKFELTGR